LTFGLLAFLLTLAGTAAGQADDTPASLDIVEQTTFVAADGVLDIHLLINTPAARSDDYRVAVVVHGRLADDSQVDEQASSPIDRLAAFDLDELAGVEGAGPGHYLLRLPIRSGRQFDQLDRVLLADPGVYPIVVELRGSDGAVASAQTHVVRLPQVTSEDGQDIAALPVSIVLPVSTAEGLTVEDTIELLTAHPDTPLTVVLGAGVQNQLATDPERTAALVSAVAGRPVLSVPTIDLDPSALAEIDQTDLFNTSTSLAKAETRQLGFNVPDDILLQSSQLTGPGAAALAAVGVTTVLDVDSSSGWAHQPIGPDTGGRLRFGSDGLAPGGELAVAVIDRRLSHTLGGGDGGPLRANRLLAKLTLRAQDGDGGPVVLGGAALGPDPMASLDAFFRALAQPGAPRPVPLTEAVGRLTIRPAERPGQDLRPIAPQLVQARQRLDTYRSFHRSGGTDPTHHHRRLVSSLDRQRNPDDRRRAIGSVIDGLDDDLTVIDLPEGQPVTLAARSAPIPIAVQSEAEGPRHVMLRFNSDKVEPVDGERLVTIPPGVSAIDVEVEARSLGISPLEVAVWTPDGRTRLATSRLEIRSTAVPGLGLLLSILAVGLLVVWWVVDARKEPTAQQG
jgi:hypothetical protein